MTASRRARVIALFALLLVCAPHARADSPRARFSDDFEKGLGAWDIHGDRGAFVQESGDATHGKVLVLRPDGDVLALIRGSERWGAVRIEGDVMFPDNRNSYLGVVYNCRHEGDRMDFGLIYIKGDGSYLMPSPHRDGNVSRLLYEEYRAMLSGDAVVSAGQWQHFRMEVVDNTAHFYVGPGNTPQVTFPLFEFDSGAVGLQPRAVGGDVWVDNVTVTRIRKFSYAGPPRPAEFQYDPEALLTAWQVAGPLERSDDALARDPASHSDAWKPFTTDARGAVITGRVVDYNGAETVAYFRARVTTDLGGAAFFNVSTVDDLALWVNGRFHGFVTRGDRAWYDFWRNPEHDGQHIPVQLVTGDNEIVVRVRGGTHASGGFYAWVERKR